MEIQSAPMIGYPTSCLKNLIFFLALEVRSWLHIPPAFHSFSILWKKVILGSFKLNPVMTASLKYLLYRKTKNPVGVKSNFQYFIFKEMKNSWNPISFFFVTVCGLMKTSILVHTQTYSSVLPLGRQMWAVWTGSWVLHTQACSSRSTPCLWKSLRSC